nr:replication protein A 70 kDa DNA-binding subunit-like [Ipomoea batatas]
MPSQYVAVKDISPFHRKRSIRVRLIRIYEVPEVRGAQTSKSLELLFHDAEGDFINANTTKDDVPKYRQIFKQGKVYSIKNFLVVKNYYLYKTTQHPFLIKFTYETQVKQIKSKGFPVYVIGRVVEIYSPLDKIIGGKPSRLIDFLIADTELAANTSPLRSISTTTVLSQSTGPSEFQSGAVIVSTLFDVFEAEEDNDFYVPAEILGIEGSGKWFYISCMKPGCNKMLTEGDDGFLKCGKCKGQFVEGIVRYKLLIRVVDRTGDAPFQLWDREVADLVGVPASLLFQNYSKVGVVIPPELEILSGMAMIFKIGFKKATMRGPNSAYNVVRVLRDQLLIDTYCSNLRDHQDKDLMSKMVEEDEYEESDSEEEASQDDEVQSPLPIDNGKRRMIDEEETDSVKKCLMDQFSTSKTTKKDERSGCEAGEYLKDNFTNFLGTTLIMDNFYLSFGLVFLLTYVILDYCTTFCGILFFKLFRIFYLYVFFFFINYMYCLYTDLQVEKHIPNNRKMCLTV